MNTPICDFVEKYAKSNAKRFHMPGHKGVGTLGIEALDITEIDGADVLYHGDGIIRESERNAAEVFGTAMTLYSAEGSSLCIRAMLYLSTLYAKSHGVSPKIAAGRNAHKAFLTAAALLDVEIDWLYSENSSVLSCAVTAQELERYFETVAERPVAVYITSPDYLGIVSDIKALSEVCKRYGALLLVDNAHGAYLHFLSESRHPIALGADICCDSAHKTLPVLTGGAYLHLSHSLTTEILEQSHEAMALFASTSPSYLILQSLDINNRYLSDGYRRNLQEFVILVDALKNALKSNGFTLIGDEPLKLTISAKHYGYRGDELAELLSEQGIICEFSDPDFVVFMLTPENGKESVEVLKNALCKIPRRQEITEATPPVTTARRYCSPREALLSLSETVPVSECEGRVTASVSVSCPPAIPITVCGEIIDRSAVERMRYYGVTDIRVVK